ncbi:hypothetical protein [Kribbella sp. CA-294648]|uniref:hypothetical protein n=1 Tax=Kribbella sp. CA-294648 TaxID=3239948 RepID=UPI003D93730C
MTRRLTSRQKAVKSHRNFDRHRVSPYAAITALNGRPVRDCGAAIGGATAWLRRR